MAQTAGHDINYIAITGALAAIGGKGGKPVPPLNLVGDNGGGASLLFGGVLCGIIEAKTSGKGQVIDAEDPLFKQQFNKKNWPRCKEIMAARFKTKTRDEWCDIMDGTDICFAPVLSMAEAPSHPHNVHRKTFVERDGWMQPAPSPRFSRTVQEIQGPPPLAGADTEKVLLDSGYSQAEVDTLLANNAVAASAES